MKRPKKKAAKQKKKTPAKRRQIQLGEPLTLRSEPKIQPEVNGSKFATVRDLTLPELWCKIEQPIHVTMLEAMRPDAPVTDSVRKRPAALVRVIDMADGKKKDLAVSEPLQKLFAMIPSGGYVGRSYRITRHRRHERKNYLGYSVEEVTPADNTRETGDA